MRRVFYTEKGIQIEKQLPEGYEGFYIEEWLDVTFEPSKFYYPGDSIRYKLDSLCVEMYELFQSMVFPSTEEYYSDYELQPQWIMRAGLDSDFLMDKEQLGECFDSPIQDIMREFGVSDETILGIYQKMESKKFRYAYVADCQYLINTLQELLLGCHSSFVGFYKHLCSLSEEVYMEGVSYECSAESRMVYSFIYSFIIQLYSCFDILTKITYELENPKECEDKYAKLSSSKILFGDKKRLKIDSTYTIFEKNRSISIVENLRNELVHNATWEMNPKLFKVSYDGIVIERYILMPDFTEEGTLVTFKNRKRFFADEKKVNNELHLLYFDVLNRIEVTLLKMLNKY